jgi:uncharacterized protein (TIGR03066 family)
MQMIRVLPVQKKANFQAGAAMTKSKWMIQMCFAAVVASSIPAITYGVDSPHSRSSIGSIFGEFPGQGGANPAGRPGEPDQGAKPVTLNGIVESLTEAGLAATVDGENAATVKIQHNRLNLSVVISLDADREKVRLEMQLTDLQGQSAPASERLMGLLAANRDFQPMFFTFSDKRKRIELVSSLPNGQVSESLRDELNKMAAIAESTTSLWESTTTTTAPAAPATSTPSTQPTFNNLAANRPAQSPATAGSSSSNLVGKWAAARSQSEAFAMQLNSDGSFVLVFVKDGKQSKSNGKFTVGGNQLTLTTSDGGKFAGQIGNLNGKSFEFTPTSGKASKLTFQRAS